MKKLKKCAQIEINVTRKDISDGAGCHSDIIVTAIRRTVSSAIRIVVDVQSIRWTDKNDRRRYLYFTPRKVAELLVLFDGGHKPKPFSFLLRGPHVL